MMCLSGAFAYLTTWTCTTGAGIPFIEGGPIRDVPRSRASVKTGA